MDTNPGFNPCPSCMYASRISSPQGRQIANRGSDTYNWPDQCCLADDHCWNFSADEFHLSEPESNRITGLSYNNMQATGMTYSSSGPFASGAFDSWYEYLSEPTTSTDPSRVRVQSTETTYNSVSDFAAGAGQTTRTHYAACNSMADSSQRQSPKPGEAVTGQENPSNVVKPKAQASRGRVVEKIAMQHFLQEIQKARDAGNPLTPQQERVIRSREREHERTLRKTSEQRQIRATERHAAGFDPDEIARSQTTVNAQVRRHLDDLGFPTKPRPTGADEQAKTSKPKPKTKPIITCHLCGESKTFTCKNELRKHMRVEHHQPPPKPRQRPSCPVCGDEVTFARNETLRAHLLRVHPQWYEENPKCLGGPAVTKKAAA